MKVGCNWCISILHSWNVPASSCYLNGLLLYRSPVVAFFAHGHPRFWNLNSTIPVDVIGVKSNVDNFFDPMCVPVRVSISKTNLVPNWIIASLMAVFRNG